MVAAKATEIELERKSITGTRCANAATTSSVMTISGSARSGSATMLYASAAHPRKPTAAMNGVARAESFCVFISPPAPSEGW